MNVKFFNNKFFFGVFAVVVLVVLFFVFFSVVRAQVPEASKSECVHVNNMDEHGGDNVYIAVTGGLAARVRHHSGVPDKLAQNYKELDVQDQIVLVTHSVEAPEVIAHVLRNNEMDAQDHIVPIQDDGLGVVAQITDDLDVQDQIVPVTHNVEAPEVIAHVLGNIYVNLGNEV